VELEEVVVPPPQPIPAEIARAIGSAAVLNGHEHRVRRAAGRGYPDLVRLRAGRLEDAPDAIALPGNSGEVARILEICSREGVAVVPFGGGTSVVGGVEPLRGGFESLLSLDLRRLREIAVDRRSLTATLGPGLRGPEAEEALNAQGATLGHFPQSFEYATIWPLRSAGDVDRAHRAGRRPANARDSAQRRRPGAP
jgi:alkyldihydroxyacetonephosphate synthase